MHSVRHTISISDVGDLQNFVTIAITTAAGGEDVYTRDRLSNLRTVGIGFATLIYKLPQDCGYRELVKRCNSLWEALSRDKKLPKLMVSSDCCEGAKLLHKE